MQESVDLCHTLKSYRNRDVRTWLTRGSIVARVALAAAAVGNAVRLLGAVAVLNARKRLAAQPMVSSVAYAACRVACAVCNVTAVAVCNASIW